MKCKNRKQKLDEYTIKYKDIPREFDKRLSYMYDLYKINDKKALDIINKRRDMMNSLLYTDIKVILYEEPEGAKRPRFRIINRKNIAQVAMANSEFVHVYSPNAHEDNVYMKRLMGDELLYLNTLIYTPCEVYIDAYFKTPSSLSNEDKFLAEIGLIRHIYKPDFDNIGKKYSDMFNSNIWLDDSLVVDGKISKFYSILPRIEITVRYLNMVYCKYQYNSISKKVDHNVEYFGGNKNGN